MKTESQYQLVLVEQFLDVVLARNYLDLCLHEHSAPRKSF